MGRRNDDFDLGDVASIGIKLLPQKYQLPAAIALTALVFVGLLVGGLVVMAAPLKLSGQILPAPIHWIVDMAAPNQKPLSGTPAHEAAEEEAEGE